MPVTGSAFSARWAASPASTVRSSCRLATMGPGVPYAIGAEFAYPDRPVFALVGDGAMQMNGLAELSTVAKYWRDWSDPRFCVLVLNNRDLNQVTWELRAMAGEARVSITQDIPDVHYAQWAELIGLKGIRVDRPEQIAGAWDQALAPTARHSSRRSPTPQYRRCHRTSRSSRANHSCTPCSEATRKPEQLSRNPPSKSSRSSCPAAEPTPRSREQADVGRYRP